MEDEQPTSTAEVSLATTEEAVVENVDRVLDKVQNLSIQPTEAAGEPEQKTSTPPGDTDVVVDKVVETESRQVEVDKPLAAADKPKDKINILLKAVGDAPILKQKLWAVPADRAVYQVVEFVKKYLKLEPHQNLFVFVNQAFAPSPDQPLRELYECFGSDGKITLHYSTTYAWG